MTSDKLQQLSKMLEREPRDAFLLYGIAMEHKKLNDPQQAIEFFNRVVEVDPNYCYAYYQLGQVRESQDETTAAVQAYRDGIAAAVRAKDDHAKSELETALAMLE